MGFSQLSKQCDQSISTHHGNNCQNTNTHKSTQACTKEKYWTVVQFYELIWIWYVSLPEALDVCMWVWAWLCRCGLMLCDWGQCCQQSRDMDAAQVPPCINAGMLILLSHYLTFKGPIRNSGSSSIMGSHTTNQGETLVLAVQRSGAKVLIFRKFS